MLPFRRDENCQEYIAGIFSSLASRRRDCYIYIRIHTHDNLIFENNPETFYRARASNISGSASRKSRNRRQRAENL